MPKPLSLEFKKLQEMVEGVGKEQGLDFFTTIYEVLNYDEINMVAAFGGFPLRYPHWKWGMEYDRIKKSSEYGLSKIYEMVINNDPCYAYLLESNSLVDQKIVMCHVLGHNDFFKNNFAFLKTNRKMLNQMANHSSRIRKYMEWYSVDEIELFIDRALSIENLIDMNSPYIVRENKSQNIDDEDQETKNILIGKIPSQKEYMEKYVNPKEYLEEKRQRAKEEEEKKQKLFPKEPKRDVLAFLIEYAPLKRWQADILSIIREEAYYFAPQAMTKIMNEGWASYWHAKLMTQKVMEPSELIDFADRHASVMVTSPKSLNPYKLGMELYRDIEERYDNGQFGLEWEYSQDLLKKDLFQKNTNLGKEKIFQVRKIYSDLTFIDEFLTEDFCKRNGLFTYGYDRKKQEYVIESKNFTDIKQKLLSNLTNFGNPEIYVLNANYENRSELLLEHKHYGVDLDFSFAQETLKNIRHIWSRPVHIITKVEDKKILLSYDGEKYQENIIAG